MRNSCANNEHFQNYGERKTFSGASERDGARLSQSPAGLITDARREKLESNLSNFRVEEGISNDMAYP